ncbi:serine/threonine protein kinase [Flavobacterium sp. WLB]|uniref:SpoIIE family protein phosphatase n=1 Tax=Flavobacterium panici TaxID=2654843 RepID=A0A9N8J2N1_9FLAO|nr:MULTISPECIES: SpoIIE family protein phosphatase [Flavobacterium]KOP37525.1 serine/threonine protein kinase [Flavobacterium sp. VMW]OWU92365.1 serine/threonine protein kinase [Flavobacterium sp. NLM]PUU70977.1 serine/threonine protein kinase [Flavobacterium sp. WLB]CAC9974323.1 SpoIIE family protein phosphatase [Flavobacterium panici]
MDNTFSTYKIDDRSLIAFIKREIHNLALQLGFTPHRAGETDIIVAELTSNLIKYANGGELLYRANIEEGQNEIEIYCLDKGIGFENVSKIMNDGYSSSNTLGHGLGSIKRLSNDFQIYSMKNWGCVQYVKICEKPDFRLSDIQKGLYHKAIALNYPGEKVCGDGYHIKNLKKGFQIFVGDGLGHGVNAHEAVQLAVKAFKQSVESDPAEILRDIHSKVKKSRGLVATVATVDYSLETWNICGIGNINTRIYDGLENKTYTPYNGIIGHNIPRTLNNSVVPYKKHQIIIMHSDGLRTRWNLSDMNSIFKQSPGIIASALLKENIRGTDDATILVGKII